MRPRLQFRILKLWSLKRERDKLINEKIATWGMARLAMVRPETISERRRRRLYSGPHWKIGNKYWSPRINFMKQVWFLNLWKGSSGKKISESLCLSFWKVVVCGGKRTLWISNGVWNIGISDWILIVPKGSTLLEFTPIFVVVVVVVVCTLIN